MKEFFKDDNSYTEAPVSTDIFEFKKVVSSRRSVRRFTSEAVPETVLKDCLEMALLAPNSSNLQPWEFYWVRTPALREQLNAAFFSQPAATTAPELVIAVARTRTWRVNRNLMIQSLEAQKAETAIGYYKKIVPLAYSIGPFGLLGFFKHILFFLVGLFRPMPREATSGCEMKIWAVKTTALACQNLMLALRAYGYDSCPMEGFDSRRLKSLLRLPKDAVVVMGIAAGKRAPNGVYGPRFRFESSLFLKEV